jgi:hypothetical protein
LAFNQMHIPFWETGEGGWWLLNDDIIFRISPSHCLNLTWALINKNCVIYRVSKIHDVQYCMHLRCTTRIDKGIASGRVILHKWMDIHYIPSYKTFHPVVSILVFLGTPGDLHEMLHQKSLGSSIFDPTPPVL